MPLILASGSLEVGPGGVFTSDQFAILRDLNLIALGSIGTTTSSETSSVEPYRKLGPTFGQLFYIQTTKGIGPNLITSLVNAVQDIIIYGVDDASRKSLGGPTGLGDTSMAADGTITVLYDASGCSGFGSFVFDDKGKKILDPPFIILAHELAHALHFSNGTINDTTPESEAEALAIAVENEIRSEANALYKQMTGQSANLGQRDPKNHNGGCNTPPDPPPSKPPQNPWELKCFIATGAYGSPYAAEVQALRHFRDHYLRRTTTGSLFFERFYSEYYTYSPMIATAMEVSSELAATIRSVVVDPFFGFLKVLEWYCMKDGRGNDFARHVHEVLEKTKPSGDDRCTAKIIDSLQRAQAALSSKASPPVQGPFHPSVTVAPGEIFDHLACSVSACTAERRYTLWVLVEPLLLHWRASSLVSSGATPREVAGTYCEGIGSWLGALPAPDLLLLPESELLEDLCRLKEVMFRSGESRRHFARSLLREGGDRPFEIEEILAQVGYV